MKDEETGVGTMNGRLFKVREFSAYARITPRATYEMIRDGRLEAVRVGACLRIPEEAIHKFIRPARRKGYSG